MGTIIAPAPGLSDGPAWFSAGFMDESGSGPDADRMLAESGAEDAPLFVPFRVGAGGGSFQGLKPAHGRAQLLRAAHEGLVFAHKAELEKRRDSGVSPDRLRLTGEGAASPFLRRLFADAMGLSVEYSPLDEPALTGAALAAAVGDGRFPGYAEAAAGALPLPERLEPNPALAGIYSDRYARWRRAAGL